MLQERVVRCSVGVLYFLRPLRGLDGWSAIFPQACAWGYRLDARCAVFPTGCPVRGLEGSVLRLSLQARAWGNLDARLRGAFYEGGYNGPISTHYTWEGYFVEALGIR